MFNEIIEIKANADVDPTLVSLKSKLRTAWMDGDYAAFCEYMRPGAMEILASWRIETGVRLLDVACGSGQTAIPLAQRGVRVTGVDIASNLIDTATMQAASKLLGIQFNEGDAEQLPYPDSAFDVVISMIGAMFAPRPARVAAELARVCRSRGRLHMANWTPDGMVGQMFKVVAQHVPPPEGIEPPVRWGDEDTVYERLTSNFSDIKLTRKHYPAWSYPFGVGQVVEFFRTTYGPVKRAFESLDHSGKKSLRRDLEANFAAHSKSREGATLLYAEYLDVSAIRR